MPRLPEANPTILTPEQVASLAAQCEVPDRVLVLLMAYGGLRIGEALALRRRSIDLDASRLVVSEAVAQVPGGSVIDTPKNHRRRELAVPRFLVDELRIYLSVVGDRPDAFLFPGRQDHSRQRQQSYHGFRRRFVQAARAAGLPDVTPHDLRATHATWVADSHGILAAARRLGHSNASVTTRHYARPVDERDGQVAEQLNLDHAKLTKTTDPVRAHKGHGRSKRAVEDR